MKEAIYIAIGRVISVPRVVRPPTGSRPYVVFTVQLTRRYYDNTSFARRIEVRSYPKDVDELALRLNRGDLVTISGDPEPYIQQVGDRLYANFRVHGEAEHIAELPEVG